MEKEYEKENIWHNLLVNCKHFFIIFACYCTAKQNKAENKSLLSSPSPPNPVKSRAAILFLSSLWVLAALSTLAGCCSTQLFPTEVWACYYCSCYYCYYCTPPPRSTLQWSGGLRDPGGLICCYNGCHPTGGHCSSFMTIIIIIGIFVFIIINIFFIVTKIIIYIFIFTRQIVKGFEDWVKSLNPWWWLFKVVCASWFLRLWACLGHVEGNSMKRFTIWESSSTPHFALLPFCILYSIFCILYFVWILYFPVYFDFILICSLIKQSVKH